MWCSLASQWILISCSNASRWPRRSVFDLIVATNIFVYYDALEQALENASAMLKTGGLLLTNDRLSEVNGSSIRLAGVTIVHSSLAASVPLKPWVGIGSDSSNAYIPV